MNVPWSNIAQIAQSLALAAPIVADVARQLGCIITDCPDEAVKPADIPNEAAALEAARSKAAAKAAEAKRR